MKKFNKNWFYLIIPIVLFVITFIAIGFIVDEFNMFFWPQLLRIIAVIIAIVMVLIGIVIANNLND